jgi:DNA-binding NarL/FixJ family response regulator
MYIDYHRPLGIEHELGVVLRTGGPQRTLRFRFIRGPGADFSHRDVTVLSLLKPYLQTLVTAREREAKAPLPLTTRQHEVLQFVAAGYTNVQIARRTGVAESTVRKHMENIFSRLQVDSRTAAAAALALHG